jgi:DNA-binding LacI/PurR family transcriptional regulator
MFGANLPSTFASGDGQNGSSQQPKYERLRDYVVEQISSGKLKPGASLPSEHQLARSLRIARSTVRQAMGVLERDGLVRRVHGKGTFVHDQARQRLRQGQDLFALVVPETQVGFYPFLQRSFEEAAAEVHNQVIICNSNNEIDKQGNSILQLIDNRVAGVAIVPTTSPPTPAFHIRQLQQHGIPVVCCSRGVEGIRAPLLAIPFQDVGRMAAEVILAAGHRRIAFLSGYRAQASEEYELGFRAALAQAGADPAGFSVFYGDQPTPDMAAHEREISAELEALYLGGNGPTAIFASFDSLAELAYVLLLRRGLRVPEDVSLIGFGGCRRDGALLRRLTSVTLDEVRMGTQAVELLERMRRGELPIESAETHEMPLALSEGDTLSRVEVSGPRRVRAASRSA